MAPLGCRGIPSERGCDERGNNDGYSGNPGIGAGAGAGRRGVQMHRILSDEAMKEVERDRDQREGV